MAGGLEIVWAIGLKASDGLTRIWPSLLVIASIVLSFASLNFALKTVPFGTAYAIWTGIGAAGTVILGMMWFGEAADPVRIACVTLILAGTLGLRLIAPY